MNAEYVNKRRWASAADRLPDWVNTYYQVASDLFESKAAVSLSRTLVFPRPATSSDKIAKEKTQGSTPQ
jgi:hypothetical protein